MSASLLKAYRYEPRLFNFLNGSFLSQACCHWLDKMYCRWRTIDCSEVGGRRQAHGIYNDIGR